MLTMEDLNEKCLGRILLYIEVNERIKLRKVCKKWRKVIDETWRDIKEADIINVLPTSESDRIKPRITGTNHVVQIVTCGASGQKLIAGVMKRCGDLITTLGEYRQGEDNSGLPHVITHCRNIEKLRTIIRTQVDDKNTSQLLAVNKNLKSLSLIITFKNTKVCFRKIPTDHLESINFMVRACRKPSAVILVGQKQVIRSTSLKEITLDYFDDESLELIGQKTTLEKLELKFIHTEGITEEALYHIMNLTNLKTLRLEAPPLEHRAPSGFLPLVTDKFLISLAVKLPLLEMIDIRSVAKVSNRGFKILALLKKLKVLKISECSGITDEFLPLFSGLEELWLVDCAIRDEGVIKLLEKAETMRVLHLGGTHITNKTLVAAVDATKKRDNGICLKFYRGNTKTTPETLTENSPLLKILNEP